MWANHNKAWEADLSVETLVDPGALREQVKDKYREVAVEPGGTFHFHTGRPLAARLGYDAALVDAMPDAGVESFAAAKTGATGTVVGIDMTEEMLAKSRACRVRAGRRCWRIPASSMLKSVPASTPSAAPAASPMRAASKCSAIRSWPISPADRAYATAPSRSSISGPLAS